MTEVLQNGQLLQDDLGQYLARCIVCNNTAIPDPATGTCVQCSYPQVVDDDGQCACPAVMPEGARCSNLDPLQRIANTLGVSLPGSLYSASVLITTDEGTETSTFVSDSAPLVELLEPSAAGCFDSGDRRACNALANLCVLERYTRCFALPLCTPIVLFAAKPAVPSNLCLFLTTKEPMSFSYNEATYVSSREGPTGCCFALRLCPGYAACSKSNNTQQPEPLVRGLRRAVLHAAPLSLVRCTVLLWTGEKTQSIGKTPWTPLSVGP